MQRKVIFIANGSPFIFEKADIVQESYTITNEVTQSSELSAVPIITSQAKALNVTIRVTNDGGSGFQLANRCFLTITKLLAEFAGKKYGVAGEIIQYIGIYVIYWGVQNAMPLGFVTGTEMINKKDDSIIEFSLNLTPLSGDSGEEAGETLNL